MEKFLTLVMLTGGAQAFLPVADTVCDATHTMTSPCSATLGGSVYIQIMKNASGYQLWCKKEVSGASIKVFDLKKEKVIWAHEASVNRTEFFMNNGTLRIVNVEKEDSGRYAVEVFTSDGIHVKEITFQLEVKANLFVILIPVGAALGAIVLLATCCCLLLFVKNRKKSGAAI